MSIFYSINPAKHLVHAVAGKIMTPDCIRGFRASLRQDSMLGSRYSLLVDLRTIESVQIASDEIRLLTRSPVLSEHSKRALVADSSLVFGMSRMYQMLSARDAAFKVFDAMDAANDWLGLSPSQLGE